MTDSYRRCGRLLRCLFVFATHTPFRPTQEQGRALQFRSSRSFQISDSSEWNISFGSRLLMKMLLSTTSLIFVAPPRHPQHYCHRSTADLFPQYIVSIHPSIPLRLVLGRYQNPPHLQTKQADFSLDKALVRSA